MKQGTATSRWSMVPYSPRSSTPSKISTTVRGLPPVAMMGRRRAQRKPRVPVGRFADFLEHLGVNDKSVTALLACAIVREAHEQYDLARADYIKALSLEP
jgi:hypothetical protein